MQWIEPGIMSWEISGVTAEKQLRNKTETSFKVHSYITRIKHARPQIRVFQKL